MRTKGKFLNKKQWYSFCSKHHDYDENCKICNIGSQHNIYMVKINSFFHDNFYELWFYYVNLKYKNK